MIYSAEDVLLDSAKRIMVDSNIIIAFFDQKHKFHTKVHQRLSPIYLGGADFFYVQPCLLELKEYWRRKKITECIEACITNGYYLYRKFGTAFQEFASENKKRQHLYLSDRQIKDLRATLENVANGKGLKQWSELCNIALSGAFSNLESELKKTRFIYANFDDNNVFPIQNKATWPKWQGADLIQEQYGLASSDAAILNMVNGGVNIDSVISNDGDILYAAASGALNGSVSAYTFLDPAVYV